MAIPGGPQNASGQVELYVVNAILDLFSDGLDESIWAVALEGMSRCQEVAARCCQEVAGSEQARCDILAAVKGSLPRDVHVVVRPSAAQSYNSRFGERRHQPMSEQCHLVG